MRSWVMERLRHGGGHGLRVYAQTDATWQAKQEYQVTVLNFVDAASLKVLHQDCSLVGPCMLPVEVCCLRNAFFCQLLQCERF